MKTDLYKGWYTEKCFVLKETNKKCVKLKLFMKLNFVVLFIKF